MEDKSTPSQRTLKSRAHHLKPIVRVGAAGLSEAVLAELDLALTAHELVKIKVDAGDRQERNSMVETACTRLSARCIQQIGHTATLYRQNTDTDD